MATSKGGPSKSSGTSSRPTATVGNKPRAQPRKGLKKVKEVDEYDMIFNEIDHNHDGRISVLELTRAARLIGFNPTMKEAERMIRDCNPKEKGYVNRQEFRRLFVERQAKLDAEAARLREAFSVFDTDGDGTITADEIRHVMRQLGEHLDAEAIEEMLNQVDENGDGSISIDEFAQVMSELND